MCACGGGGGGGEGAVCVERGQKMLLALCKQRHVRRLSLGQSRPSDGGEGPDHGRRQAFGGSPALDPGGLRWRWRRGARI